MNDRVAGLFAEPFVLKWIFPVETIARTIQARRHTTLSPAAEVMYELPLMS